MTEKLYLITETNRMDLISWLRQGKTQRVVNALENLTAKSLPMVDSEPVAYSDGAFGGRFTYKCLNPAMILPDNTAFYTSPQALTTITADDVTDEMVNEPHNLTVLDNPKTMIAAIYNAVIKHRSEEK